MAVSRTLVLLAAVVATVTAGSVPTCQVFQTKKSKDLQWFPGPLPSSYFRFNFRVAAVGDVKIVLSDGKGRRSDRVTILLGDKQNSQSSIRRRRQASKEIQSTANELICGEYNSYWVQFEPRSVKVGRGSERAEFMKLDFNKPLTPKFLGFGTSKKNVGLFTFDDIENQQVDPCLRSPCVHGTCRPLSDGFECDCSDGYRGQYCELKQEPEVISLPPEKEVSCSKVRCRKACPNGFEKDERGCMTCICKPRMRFGECPEVSAKTSVVGICVNECSDDESCPDGRMKCCSNGCGRVCREPCKPVFCRLGCKNGFASNNEGCKICACKDDDSGLPDPLLPDLGLPGNPEPEEEEQIEEPKIVECFGDTKEVTVTEDVDTSVTQEFEIEKEDPSDVIFHSDGGKLIKIEVEKKDICILNSRGLKLKYAQLPQWAWQLKTVQITVRFVTTGFNVFLKSLSEDMPIVEYRKPDRKAFTCKSIGFLSKGKRKSRLKYLKRRFRLGKRGKKRFRKPIKKYKGKKRPKKPKTRGKSRSISFSFSISKNRKGKKHYKKLKSKGGRSRSFSFSISTNGKGKKHLKKLKSKGGRSRSFSFSISRNGKGKKHNKKLKSKGKKHQKKNGSQGNGGGREIIIETKEETERKTITLKPGQFQEVEGIAGYETSVSFALDPEDGIIFRLTEQRGSDKGRTLSFVIEKEWSYMQYDGQILGEKVATRSGILNSGRKSFWIKLPACTSEEFWFEFGIKGEASELLRGKIPDVLFRPKYIDVSVTVTHIEEQVVEIHYPNWIPLGGVENKNYKFQVTSTEVALVAIQSSDEAEGQIIAEFGCPKNPGCRIQRCDDKEATKCKTLVEPADQSICRGLAEDRKLWVKLVGEKLIMGLDNEGVQQVVAECEDSWISQSRLLAIGTRGHGKWTTY
ncbi:uncharacterized protein LOC110991192 isoform X17 [Acanthaster planci]|uniref:Uncharacterized protein LOC110991192 isoform X16 n=1 Tax=Acanthaster planci TaxID=133434 RepID=A0A8B8A340_ACAPL|nr:uncharacterized protein LOC110991192 isoform X16 [Acanthaster planci]XP_022112138.1 uncharacterized protein LOC110991192 isoform X17 [Acanthaster planci]